ncbi:MAG: hypothetical protein ACRDE2_06535 [Chitinophagaceae bacterium]
MDRTEAEKWRFKPLLRLRSAQVASALLSPGTPVALNMIWGFNLKFSSDRDREREKQTPVFIGLHQFF